MLKLVKFLLIFLPTLAANALNTTSNNTRGITADNNVSAQLIELQFQNRKLSDAMAEVTNRSKIKIVISPNLRDVKINAEIKSLDWRRAIKSLLKEFNHIAIVDRRGEFKKIWITAKRDSKAISGVNPKRSVRVSGVDEHSEPVDSIELPIAIWVPLEKGTDSLEENNRVPSAPIQMNPSFFQRLQIGQPVEIPIPQEEFPLFGVVSENHSQLNGEVEVWSGPIDGSHETASFTVTRGEITTYVTVATGTSIYEVSLDNATGIGSVVNEKDLTKDVSEQDFVIPDETGLSSSPSIP